MSDPDFVSSRWFKVTADRFDWVVRPTMMRSWKKGEIGYAPQKAIDIGLASGLIEVIKKPRNAHVGKDGQVYFT